MTTTERNDDRPAVAAADANNSPVPDRSADAEPVETEERDEAAVTHFVEEFATVMVDAGMPRMPARVMASLMASPRGALTAAELSAQLDVSAAAVSGAIRYLSQMRLVSRGREPGTRRDLYRVQQNVWYASFTARDQLLAGWLETLEVGIDAVGPHTEAGERLRESSEFLDFLMAELGGILDRWNERQAERRSRTSDPQDG